MGRFSRSACSSFSRATSRLSAGLLLFDSRLLVIGAQAVGHAVRILAKDAFPFHATERDLAVVVTGLDTLPDDLAVHHVGLEEDDGSPVNAIGQEVAGPEIAV